MVEISPKVEENGFFNVEVKYIDEGRTSQVQNYQLLHLPAKFQRLPPQAVEFVVCRVKPIDNEVEWNPKVILIILRGISSMFFNFRSVLFSFRR